MNEKEIHDKLWSALSTGQDQTLRDTAMNICQTIRRQNEPPFVDPQAEAYAKKLYEALIVEPLKGLVDIGSIM